MGSKQTTVYNSEDYPPNNYSNPTTVKKKKNIFFT